MKGRITSTTPTDEMWMRNPGYDRELQLLACLDDSHPSGPECPQLCPRRPKLLAPPLFLESREGIDGHLGQHRVDHERNLARVSYTACRFAIGTCSSCRCAYAVAPGP